MKFEAQDKQARLMNPSLLFLRDFLAGFGLSWSDAEQELSSESSEKECWNVVKEL